MYFDFFLAGLILIFAVAGFINGFLKQIISLACLLSIIFLASPLATWLKTQAGLEEAPTAVLWCAAAGAFILASYFVSYIVEKFKIRAFVRPVDHWLGFGFGAVKGVVLVIGIGLALQLIPESTKLRFSDLNQDMEDSYFVGASSEMVHWGAFEDIHNIMQRINEPEVKRVPATKPWLWETDPDSQ